MPVVALSLPPSGEGMRDPQIIFEEAGPLRPRCTLILERTMKTPLWCASMSRAISELRSWSKVGDSVKCRLAPRRDTGPRRRLWYTLLVGIHHKFEALREGHSTFSVDNENTVALCGPTA